MKLPFYRSLRFRVIGIFTLVVLLSSIVSTLSTLRVAEKEFTELLHNQFHGTTGIIENFFDMVGQMGFIWGKQFSSDGELRDLLQNDDHKLIIKRLAELKNQATADSVIWLDMTGRVHYHSEDEARHETSLMGWRIVRSGVLEHKRDSSIVQDLGNFIIYSSTLTLDKQGNPNGIILIGYAINDYLIKQIKKETHVDITVVRRRAIMASTFNTPDSRMSNVPLSYIEYQMLLSEDEKVREIRINDNIYFAEAEPLKSMDPSMEGSILLTYPQDILATIQESLVTQFILLSVGVLLVVLLIANSLSLKMLTPIYQLIERTNTISDGDMSSRIKVKSRDEVGLLARHFNRMIEVIEGKNRALQSYSDNLEQIVAERTHELERKGRSLSNAQRIAQMGSWAWNLDNDELEVSDEVYRLLGLKRNNQTHLLEQLLHRLHPDDRRVIHEARKEAVCDSRIRPFSFRLRHPNGEERIIQAEGEHFDGLAGSHGLLEGTVHDITERRLEEAAMLQRANYDALTKLPNRNLFQDRLQQAMKVAHREKHQLALMFIDLDRFKWVNDNLGHDAGDELLQQVSERLSDCMREADTIARMGGDEFTAILPEVESILAVEMVAQRMLTQLVTPFTLLGKHEIEISGSIGISLYPQDSDTTERLLKHADVAMYQAKKSGRNNFRFYQDEPQSHSA